MMKATPSSIDSLLQRVRQYRYNLDASSDSEEEPNAATFHRRSHTLADHKSSTSEHKSSSSSSALHRLSAHSNTNIHFQSNEQNIRDEPSTPKFSTSTISSSNVRKLRQIEQARNQPVTSDHSHSDGHNLPIPSSSSSNMSISSPSSIQQIFEKIQSFKAELNISSNENKPHSALITTTPLQHTQSRTQHPQFNNTNNLNYEISSLHDTPSLLQPQPLRSMLSSSSDAHDNDNGNDSALNQTPLRFSISSPLVPAASKSKDKPNTNNAKQPNLSIESQTIANVAPQFSHKKRHKKQAMSANQERKTNQDDNDDQTSASHSTSTRKSQKLDLKQFLSLPSPPKQATQKKQQSATIHPPTATQQRLNERMIRQQISPFHEQYKSQMKQILNVSKTPSVSECSKRVHSNLSETHYNYTSPSVISDDPLVPTHLLLQFPPPTHNTYDNNGNGNAKQPAISLQDAYKRHRQSIDLKRKRSRSTAANKRSLSAMNLRKSRNRHKRRIKQQKSRPTQLNHRNLHQSPPKPMKPKSNKPPPAHRRHHHHHHDANDPFCPCSCHDSHQNATPMPPESSNEEEDDDDEEEEEEEEKEEKKSNHLEAAAHGATDEEDEDAKQDRPTPVISSTIGTRQKRGSHLKFNAQRKYSAKKKKNNNNSTSSSHSSQAQSAMYHHPISPPIARPIRRRIHSQKKKKKKAEVNRTSDLDSDAILEQHQYTTSLCLSGKVINDLVRLSAISPSPIWYNNRRALHIKEIRNYSSEYSIISFVCCALWTKYDLEVVKLFKLSWSQRIMSFAEPSVMFYVIDVDIDADTQQQQQQQENVAKYLFNLAETRFGGLERIELKYRLECEEHKFSLMCIVDSYYVIDEHDRYFVDQSHCIPSYLIRNKNPLLV